MTRKAPHRPLPRRPEKSAGKAALLGALSLLSASMGLRLDDEAHASDGSVTVNKAKTADKAFNAMDGYIRGRQVKQPTKVDPATVTPPASVKRK